jgi:hypothetical protein
MDSLPQKVEAREGYVHTLTFNHLGSGSDKLAMA